MYRHRLVLALALVATALTSCGYHFGQGSIPNQYRSISVPYIIGDEDGDLTAAVIKEIGAYGGLCYRDRGADLILKASILDIVDEDIGFRYQRNKNGTINKNVVPIETRISTIVELSVVEAATCKVILGPVIITTPIDFDHDYYSSRDGVNVFTLGQVNDVEEAYDSVMRPLNRATARKIVEYISESW